MSAVLVLGGSEGGLATSLQAALLPAHGYPALALAYFGVPGLPPSLHNIPLEYFVTALKLLATQPGVDPHHILVWGISRGSEAALLLGVHFPQLVHGVIATVPSGVVNSGFPVTDPPQPAWTLNGTPLPFATRADYERHDISPTSNAVIPVEQIPGPLFLLCAGHDRIWLSCPYTDAITARLSSHHFPYPVSDLHYPAAGHLAGGLLPYLPFAGAASPTDTLTKTGGTELADQQAEADAWPHSSTFWPTSDLQSPMCVRNSRLSHTPPAQAEMLAQSRGERTAVPARIGWGIISYRVPTRMPRPTRFGPGHSADIGRRLRG